MLLCKQIGCGWHVAYLLFGYRAGGGWPPIRKENPMSRTASIAFAPAGTFFGRLFARIDRLLLAYAEMTIRNGDVPRSCV